MFRLKVRKQSLVDIFGDPIDTWSVAFDLTTMWEMFNKHVKKDPDSRVDNIVSMPASEFEELLKAVHVAGYRRGSMDAENQFRPTS